MFQFLADNDKSDTDKSVGGAVASWLVRSTPDRAFRVRALAGDIVLCSWERHFTLTVSLSTQGTGKLPPRLHPFLLISQLCAAVFRFHVITCFSR